MNDLITFKLFKSNFRFCDEFRNLSLIKSKQASPNIIENAPKVEKEKITKYKCIKTIYAHNDWVEKIILLKSGKIMSCSQDCTLKLWDLDSTEASTPIMTYKGHTAAVLAILQISNDKILSISKDKTIRKWAISSGTEIYCFTSNQPFIYSYFIYDHIDKEIIENNI